MSSLLCANSSTTLNETVLNIATSLVNSSSASGGLDFIVSQVKNTMCGGGVGGGFTETNNGTGNVTAENQTRPTLPGTVAKSYQLLVSTATPEEAEEKSVLCAMLLETWQIVVLIISIVLLALFVRLLRNGDLDDFDIDTTLQMLGAMQRATDKEKIKQEEEEAEAEKKKKMKEEEEKTPVIKIISTTPNVTSSSEKGEKPKEKERLPF